MPIHYPGYNYCGPGTKDFSRKKRNRLDAACRQHDKGYKTTADYFFWNKADDDLLDALERYKDDDPTAARIMSAIFRLKKSLNQVTIGQVTGSKRYGGKITDWAKPKKRRTRKPKRANDNIDDTAESKGSDEPISIGAREPDQGMPSGNSSRSYRKRVYRKKRRTKNRRKRQRNSKATGSFNQRIARILNPALVYEHQSVDAVRLTASFSSRYSVLFDPQVYCTNTTTGVSSTHGFNGLTPICAMISVTTGDTLAIDDIGKQYWIMKQHDKYRLTNATSGVLFYKVYYLKCFAACDQLINLIDNNTVEGDTALYPNNDTTLGGGNSTYGSTIGVAGINRWGLPRTMSLNELKTLKHAWKVVRSYNFKLQPNENHTVHLKRKNQIFDPANHIYGTTTFAYIPGNIKVLIQVSSTITGSTTAPPAGEQGWDYMAYGLINVPFEYYSTCEIAKRTTTQQRRYQSVPINPTAGSTTLSTTPAIIGDPVQTGGAAQAMAD